MAVAAAALMLLSRGRAPNLLDELRRSSDVFGRVAAARNGVPALSAFWNVLSGSARSCLRISVGSRGQDLCDPP